MKPDASRVGVRTGIHVAQNGTSLQKDTELNAYDDNIWMIYDDMIL